MPAGLIRADALPGTGFVGSGGEAAVQCRCESPTPTVPGSFVTVFPGLAEILDERPLEAAGRSKSLIAGARLEPV